MSSSALSFSDNSIDTMWGPGFIGFIVSVGLYGLTISQTLHYYQYYYREDELTLKLLVLLIFSLDSFHVYTTAHSFWRYFIEGRIGSTLGNALPWQLIASLMTTYVITFVVQSYYGYRVFKVSRHNKIILGAICFFALVQLASGAAFVAEEINASANSRTDIFSNSAVLILELSSTVLGDLLITCATVWYLRAERTGMQMTEKLVHRLVVHAINMGMVGGVVALVQLIVFVARRREMLFFAPNLVVSKCYVNSLLATLNARHSIRDARDAWMDDDNAHGGIVLHRVGNHSSAGLWGRHKTPMDTKELRRFRLAMQKHADSMSMATAGDEEVPHDRKYADRGDAKSALKNYEIKAQGSVFVMGDLAA